MVTNNAKIGRTRRWHHSPNVPMAEIRRFARQIVRRFEPNRIILFGSYAYGRPHADSDVDILVEMPARDEMNKALQIWNTLEPPFALDLIVRTPRNLAWRLEAGDDFLREILCRGKVLYEKTGEAVGSQSRSRPQCRRGSLAKTSRPV